MNIEGKVADTPDEYTVVVNIGSEDGVKETHRYVIYSESEPIVDPETGEELGSIEYKVAEVKPTQIHESHSVMRTNESIGGFNFKLPGYKKEPKKLTNDPDFVHGDYNVRTGDSVKFLKDMEKND